MRTVQAISKRLFPDCVKLDEKVVLCLPTAGRRTQFFHPTFSQPGKSLLEVPCSEAAARNMNAGLEICANFSPWRVKEVSDILSVPPSVVQVMNTECFAYFRGLVTDVFSNIDQ